MPKNALAGFDIGTSKIRCILYSEKGNILLNSSYKTPLINTSEGHYNPTSEIIKLTLKILKKTFKFSNDNNYLIKGIAFSSVGEAGVPIDKNLKELLDIIPWYDQRTKSIRDNIINNKILKKIYKITGLNNDHFFSVYKLLWIKKNKPNLFKKIYKWLPVNDYVAMKLTGEISTDHSQALRTLMYNPKKLKWSQEMLSEFKINKKILPKIINSGDKKGYLLKKIKKILNIKYDCVVVNGGHDHFVGIFALGGFKKNTIVDSLGSAEAVTLSTNYYNPDISLQKSNFITGVFKTKFKAYYYIVASILTSGLIIEWFKETFNIKDFNQLNKILKTSKIRKNLIFFPQFEYSHSPINVPKTNGFIGGIDRSTTVGDIYKSILESLSFDTMNAIEFMQLKGKVKVNKVISSGGSAQNIAWMKLRANIFKKDIYIDKNIENVSFGSALLAGIGSGIFKNETEAFKNFKSKFRIIKKNKILVNEYKLLFEKYKENIVDIIKVNQNIEND